jgi:hypothetical protein
VVGVWDWRWFGTWNLRIWGFCWRSGKFMDDFICTIFIRRDQLIV